MVVSWCIYFTSDVKQRTPAKIESVEKEKDIF